MASSSRRGSQSGIQAVQGERPNIKWSLDPNDLMRAVQSALITAKGPMSVEDLVSVIEKQHKITIPGDGVASKRMVLNSVLRLVDPEDGGLQLRRRYGVSLPEHLEADYQLRETLRAKGLSEDDINEVVSGVRQTRKTKAA